MKDQALIAQQEILAALHKRIADFKEGYRQNIALLGDELIGKTTLLRHFLSHINLQGLLPVYVEVTAAEPELFARRFLNSLLYNLLKNGQLISSRDTLENIAQRAAPRIPATAPLIEGLLGRIGKDRPEVLLKDLFLILESTCRETQQRAVVILDEFQHIFRLGAKNVSAELSKRIMFQKDALFIFSSSSRSEAKDILSDELALLFGNFETLECGPLSAAACAVFLREALGESELPDGLRDFLIHFTGGHPFYLKMIAQEAAAQCGLQQKKTLDLATLKEALQKTLFDDWGVLNRKFLTSLALLTPARNKNDLIHVLDAIAQGQNRIKDLVASLKKPKKEIAPRLHRLIEHGLIAKNGSFYSLQDRLMAFWLKMVHHEKFNSLSPSHEEQALNFCARIDSEIDGFASSQRKDMADRVMDILSLFEGDSILVNKKHLQLSPFKELKLIEIEGSGIKLGVVGRSRDNWWIILIKQNPVREQDVNELVDLAKRFKRRQTNKILIGLDDIDHNARLLAKQSSVLTWDTQQINSLFDLFGRPRFVK